MQNHMPKWEEKGSLGRFWTKVEKMDKTAQNIPKRDKSGHNRKKPEKRGNYIPLWT